MKSPALFRDALMAAFDVLGSDLRYKRKDLAVYLAYLTKQGKKANKEIWEAQKAFLEQQLGNEEKPQQVLEPVLTVSPDELSLEVFSRDESSYARLSLPPALFENREAAHGSTTLSVDEAFIARFERMRSWQPVALEATSRGERRRRADPPGALGAGCATSCRCSRPPRCPPRWPSWRPSTSTTCSSCCAPGPRRSRPAGCASSWCPARSRAS